MSLRWRLILWYAGLICFVVLGLVTISYKILSDSLKKEIDNTLVERANHVADAVSVVPNRPIEGISEETSDEFRSPGVYLQILDTDGNIIAHSFNLGRQEMPISDIDQQRLLSGTSFYQTLDVEGQLVRLYHQPLSRDNMILGGVQVGQSLNGLETAQRQLLLSYTISGIVVLCFGTIGGWITVYFGLQPIARLSETAQEIIATEDLKRRVETHSGADEISKLEETFNQMLNRLQSLFESQQRFLAEVAHELRTPLSSMLGNVDLLIRYGDDPIRKSETTSALQRTGHHVSRLLNDLLLLAQAEAGWKLQLRPLRLDDLLIEVYEEMQFLSTSNQAKWQFGKWESGIVMGDTDRLRQVLINLIDNAVKYSSTKSIIVLELWSSDGQVYIRINSIDSDISTDEIQKVFKPFFRAKAHSATTLGSGLGLSIVQWIVHEHNGQIVVDSTPNSGTSFTLSLPEYYS